MPHGHLSQQRSGFNLAAAKKSVCKSITKSRSNICARELTMAHIFGRLFVVVLVLAMRDAIVGTHNEICRLCDAENTRAVLLVRSQMLACIHGPPPSAQSRTNTDKTLYINVICCGISIHCGLQYADGIDVPDGRHGRIYPSSPSQRSWLTDAGAGAGHRRSPVVVSQAASAIRAK